MSDESHEQGSDKGGGPLEIVATAANGAEADLICARLAEAGIGAEYQRSIGSPTWGQMGGQYIYVQPSDLARAKEVLSSSEGFSEDELIEAQEAAEGKQDGD